jgi:hypothetical protein
MQMLVEECDEDVRTNSTVEVDEVIMVTLVCIRVPMILMCGMSAKMNNFPKNMWI